MLPPSGIASAAPRASRNVPVICAMGAVHRRRIEFFKRLAAAAVRGDHQDVEPAEALLGRTHGLVNRAFVRHVQCEPEGALAADGIAHLAGRGGDALGIATGHRHGCPLSGQRDRHGQSQVPGTSGDKGNFSRKIKHPEEAGRGAGRPRGAEHRWPAPLRRFPTYAGRRPASTRGRRYPQSHRGSRRLEQ